MISKTIWIIFDFFPFFRHFFTFFPTLISTSEPFYTLKPARFFSIKIQLQFTRIFWCWSKWQWRDSHEWCFNFNKSESTWNKPHDRNWSGRKAINPSHEQKKRGVPGEMGISRGRKQIKNVVVPRTHTGGTSKSVDFYFATDLFICVGNSTVEKRF